MSQTIMLYKSFNNEQFFTDQRYFISVISDPSHKPVQLESGSTVLCVNDNVIKYIRSFLCVIVCVVVPARVSACVYAHTQIV